MKKITSLTLSSMILAGINSCQNPHTVSEIQLGNAKDAYTMSDLVKPIKFTALESSDSCLLNSIGKVIRIDWGFIVSDNTIDRQIMAFGNDGKFIRSYGRSGHGPGEYQSVTDIALSCDGDSLKACVAPSVVYTYAFDGTLTNKESITGNVPLTQLSTTPEQIAMTSNNIAPHYDLLYLFSSEMKPLGSLLPCEGGFTVPFCDILKSDGSYIYYMDWYNNALYQYDASNQQIKASFRFNMPNSLKSEHISDPMSFISQQQIFGFIMDWGLIDDKLVLEYIISGESYVLVYCLKSNAVVMSGKYEGMILSLQI